MGLAIDDSGVFAAEVSIRAHRPEVQHTGFMQFDEKLSSDNAKDLGRRLRQFLHENRLSSKKAVVGIPTKWIATKEIVAPPVTADSLPAMLGIQAERAFSLNADELIFDYCGKTSTSEKSDILLVATKRQVISQIKGLTAAAGLQVRAITVSTLSLDKHLPDNESQQRYGLYTRPTYCEFWSRSNGRLRSIQHVPMSGTSDTTERRERLTSAIQRLVLLASEQNQSPPYEITMYDASGLPDGIVEKLDKHLKPQITISDGKTTILSKGAGSKNSTENSQSIAAASLAITTLSTGKLPVDFLNPHIGRKQASERRPVTKWIVAAAGILIVVAGAVIADLHGKNADISAYSERLELIEQDVAAARELVDRISYAGSWTSRNAEFIESIKQLTLAFPEYPRVWATSLALSEQAEGSLVGKASDEMSFYEVLDKMKQNEAFSDVMMMHLRDAGGSSTEKEFAVTFKYRGLK